MKIPNLMDNQKMKKRGHVGHGGSVKNGLATFSIEFSFDMETKNLFQTILRILQSTLYKYFKKKRGERRKRNPLKPQKYSVFEWE